MDGREWRRTLEERSAEVKYIHGDEACVPRLARNPGWRNAVRIFGSIYVERASAERNYSPAVKLVAHARHICMNIIHHIHDIT